jgi:hypothetical protein
MKTEAINTLSNATAPADAEKEILKRMEDIQDVVNPYLQNLGIPENPSEILDQQVAQTALNTLNEIRIEGGEEPITSASMTRRLLTLLNRVAMIVEEHLLHQRDIAHNEETRVRDELLPEIQSWTRWQGSAHALAGFGGPALMVLSPLLPAQFQTAFQTIAQSMLSPAASAGDKMVESWKMPGEHERTLYFNTRQEREQAMQIYNQLPDKVQGLVSKLVDQVMAMYRTTSQR